MTEEFELLNTRPKTYGELDLKDLITRYDLLNGYAIIKCNPAKGILYITEDNHSFISGQIRMRGKNEGRYPFHYLKMIDNIFGYEPNTIEVCSRSVRGRNNGGSCFTVDINSQCKPDLVTNGETLEGIAQINLIDGVAILHIASKRQVKCTEQNFQKLPSSYKRQPEYAEKAL
jgi:hypothetical protein